MPKIPQVYSQVGLPDAGMSSARLQAPRGEGSGNASLGQDMQSIANLYPSFLAGQAQRDAISAKAANFQRSLLANGEIISSRGAFAREAQTALEIMDKSGRYDTMDYTDESGVTQHLDPQEVMSKTLGGVFYQRLARMQAAGFDDATMAMVGDELQKEALMALSGFSTAVLTKRIQAGKGQLHEQLAAMKPVAGDPTNPRRDQDELIGLSLIEKGKQTGVLNPEEAAKEKTDWQAGIHDTRWTIIAQTNPQAILGIHANLAGQSEYALPVGMDPAKFDNYVKLAQGTLATQQSNATRFEEQQTKANNERLDLAESDLTSQAYRGDISQTLEQQRLALGLRYDKLKTLNRSLVEAREKDQTQDDTKRSSTNRFPLMVSAKGAKFTGDFSQINENVVSQAVASHRLTPQDGEAVLQAITEARAYQRTADSDSNRRMSKAESVLKSNFFVPTTETKYSSQVKDLEAQALTRFYTELEQNPKQDPYVLGEQIMSDYRPLIVQSKGVVIEDLTEQLRGAMKQFPKELFVPGTFQMDPAKADQAVQAGAISRATVKQYRSLYDTRQALSEDAASKAQSKPAAPAKRGGLFGKGQ